MNSLGYIARVFEVSLSEIGRQIDVSPQTVNDWVKNKRRIPQKRIEQLVDIFRLSKECFAKTEEELNEVERLTIKLKYYQSINKLKEDKQYRYWSHQDEINALSKKIEDKKLLLSIEQLFQGGGRWGELNYNPQGVKNYQLFEAMVKLLSNAEENKEQIDELVILLLGEKQKRKFDIVEYPNR
ncbi:helix-turn-helix domain-containing protein [Niallia nealsonii]|uniref:HTH cro/C1-type domain-containing protein n=1 Tax=Niallia nealsonii TaxID=115979 RepID=A0A2N0Z4C7_9BACI|nr:helix-turn-helix domain-containing protein [Niallia nealsonii]PKG24368.1 hypothetical protein CWS01_07065 [Niallia nealsonii]